LNPIEIATFLKENPLLDKKMIGEYISNRNNVDVLNSFIKYVLNFNIIENGFKYSIILKKINQK